MRRVGGWAWSARGGPPRSRFALLGMMGALAAGALSPAPAESGQMADRIVAVVNTEVIMLSELKSETEPEVQRLREQYRGAELDKRVHQAEYTTLTRIIERRLQVQMAASKGHEVTEAEVQQAIEEMKKQGDSIEEKDPLKRKAIKDQLTLMRFVEREIRGAVLVFDPEMRKYYETHQKRFSLPEEFRLSQILFLQRSTENAAEFRRRADKVHQALKAGADFGDMALEHSAGAEAGRRGNLGFVRQGELLPEIERAVADLQPGQFTEPIESPQGLHIIRLEEKKRPEYRPFAEVKSEIQAIVYQQKSEDFYQEWLGDLKNKAYIEIKF